MADISFGNPMAVRAGLLAAVAGLVLSFVPLPFLLGLLWRVVSLLGVGFLSIHLYMRRSRQYLSVRSGARMGWITGVFSFVISAVLFTVLVLGLNLAAGELEQALRQRLLANGFPTGSLDEMLATLRSPLGVLGTLLSLFLQLTFLPILGGMLGAKVLDKE